MSKTLTTICTNPLQYFSYSTFLVILFWNVFSYLFSRFCCISKTFKSTFQGGTNVNWLPWPLLLYSWTEHSQIQFFSQKTALDHLMTRRHFFALSNLTFCLQSSFRRFSVWERKRLIKVCKPFYHWWSLV